MLLKIEFPTELSPEAVKGLKAALPPALNVPSVKDDDPSCEVHYTTDMDPVASFVPLPLMRFGWNLSTGRGAENPVLFSGVRAFGMILRLF